MLEFDHATVRQVSGYILLIQSYFFFLLITSGNQRQARKAVLKVQDKMLDGRKGLSFLPKNRTSVTLPASDLNTLDAQRRFDLVSPAMLCNSPLQADIERQGFRFRQSPSYPPL